MLVCGTTSILDEAGHPLDGNSDGTEGDDHRIDLGITATNLLSNPNLDGDLDGWDRTSPVINEITFSAIDADGAPTSGSARIENLSGPDQSFELTQCVDLSGGGHYLVGGLVAVDSVWSSAPRSRVVTRLFDGTGCTGNLIRDEVLAESSGDLSRWSEVFQ